MAVLGELFVVFISAILLENVAFSRGLGISRTAMLAARPQPVVVFNLSILFMCTVSSILGFGANYLMVEFIDAPPTFLREAVLFVAVLVSYTLLYWLMKKKIPQYLAAYQSIISFGALSCAVYGSLMISVANTASLLVTVVRGVGTGFGMMLATWLVYFGRKRLALCDLPRAFRGLPIILLYMGLISLALYGLVGHSLPT